MSSPPNPIVILLADDDEEDRMFVCDALNESRLLNEVHCVTDGEDLMDFLLCRNKYVPPYYAPRPGLILLDLNMPKMDGREALRAIKANPLLQKIPIVIMTTSGAEDDISDCYQYGASSFITKPVTFKGLINVMQIICEYWFMTVELPVKEEIST